MFYKLKIIEFYYIDEEDLDTKLNDAIQEQKNLGWSVSIKQVLEQDTKYSEQFGERAYIKIVLELT